MHSDELIQIAMNLTWISTTMIAGDSWRFHTCFEVSQQLQTPCTFSLSFHICEFPYTDEFGHLEITKDLRRVGYAILEPESHEKKFMCHKIQQLRRQEETKVTVTTCGGII